MSCVVYIIKIYKENIRIIILQSRYSSIFYCKICCQISLYIRILYDFIIDWCPVS